jgi:hypothetical protein
MALTLALGGRESRPEQAPTTQAFWSAVPASHLIDVRSCWVLMRQYAQRAGTSLPDNLRLSGLFRPIFSDRSKASAIGLSPKRLKLIFIIGSIQQPGQLWEQSHTGSAFWLPFGPLSTFGRGFSPPDFPTMLVRVNYALAGFKSLPIVHGFVSLRSDQRENSRTQ